MAPRAAASAAVATACRASAMRAFPLRVMAFLYVVLHVAYSAAGAAEAAAEVEEGRASTGRGRREGAAVTIDEPRFASLRDLPEAQAASAGKSLQEAAERAGWQRVLQEGPTPGEGEDDDQEQEEEEEQQPPMSVSETPTPFLATESPTVSPSTTPEDDDAGANGSWKVAAPSVSLAALGGAMLAVILA